MTTLAKGGIYEVRSRNLRIAAYDGSGGFIGIREKLGSRYLFTEYLRTGDSGPLGTVTPGPQVASLIPGIPLEERLAGATCTKCGQPAWWTGPPAPAPWKCEGGCAGVMACGNANTRLFTALQVLEEEK